MELEKLLNKLIEKGWKPFGREYAQIIQSSYRCFRLCDKNPNADKGEKPRLWINSADKRELASKESGLWQFVCENGMIKHEIYEDIHSWTFTTAEHSDFWFTDGDNYEYYIIESALCNEDKLEQYLLDNIKL